MKLRDIDWRRKLRPLYAYGKKVPPVLRSVLGLVLIGLGILGFLPILGFWMVPLGAMFIALDVPPLRRRVERWLDRDEATSAA
jgi:hypothetical protein